jgi:hypothetical protein
MADREAEDADDEFIEDEEIEEPIYETTDWFSFLTKPVHVGWYEVRTTAWPFPQKVEWTGSKWLTDNDVTDWRGITQNEHNMLVELQKLKDEFDNLLTEE